MKVIAVFLLLAFPVFAYSWDCPETKNSSDIPLHWKTSNRIFYGTIVEAKYDEEEEHDKIYFYKVLVKGMYKGDVPNTIELYSGWWAPLTIGEQYIFFQKRENIEFCDLVLAFDLEWAIREDIDAAKYVRKIIELSKEKP